VNILCIADACPILLSSKCVFYESTALPNTGIDTNDTLQVALQKIDEAIGNAGGTTTWGGIVGTVTNQTDLITYLGANFYPLSSNPAGYLTSETDPVFTAWLAGPPNVSEFTNDAGYLTAVVGYVPNTREITINGVTFDLSANRVWTISAGIWGAITGSLPDQTDLQAALDAKADVITRTPVSISAGTLTLDLDSKDQKKFENTTAISSDFTIAFSNTTNAEIFSLIILITGSVAITMPSTVIMEKVDGRFVNGTKILTLTGVTAEPFELSFSKMNGPLFMCRASYANHAS